MYKDLRLRRILLAVAILALALPIATFAQQNGHYSQHMLNKYQFNPAFAGLERSLSISFANRSQWSKLSQNPNQQALSAHLPVYLINGGVGLLLENETLGLEKNTSIQFSYNYVVQNTLGIFSAGAGIGFYRKQLNGAGILTPEGEYQGGLINHNDPELIESVINGSTAQWQIGIYYAGKFFESGFSIQNLPAHALNLNPTKIELKPRYIFYAESGFDGWTTSVKLRPSMMIMLNAQEIQLTSSVIADFGNILVGLGLRGFDRNSLEGLNFILGMHINKNIRLSYSYDYGLNSLQDYSEGSHELLLNYNLQKLIGLGLPPKIIYNPRNM